MTRRILHIALAFAVAITLVKTWAAGDIPTKLSNQGSIINTRHNMTLRNASGTSFVNTFGTAAMDSFRNNYEEVCVYCHTPHGANANVPAPLWNRNFSSVAYTTYNQLNTTSLTQTVYQPGAASMPCLSCHDGQQAVDSIINMPGSGRYSTNPDNTFLDSWQTVPGHDNDSMNGHGKLSAASDGTSCLVCHQPGSPIPGAAADFTAATIGTDLRNDHPVGVTFPSTTGNGTDWNTPGGLRSVGNLSNKFFDDNGNQRMDKTEIRLYDGGNGPSVECASCHDPHGVPSAGTGSKFNPTFLRKTNGGSAVCLTCHIK
jgi:hypothetical protein